MKESPPPSPLFWKRRKNTGRLPKLTFIKRKFHVLRSSLPEVVGLFFFRFFVLIFLACLDFRKSSPPPIFKNDEHYVADMTVLQYIYLPGSSFLNVSTNILIAILTSSQTMVFICTLTRRELRALRIVACDNVIQV